MKIRLLILAALSALFAACNSVAPGNQADPAQVARISAVASALTQSGAAIYLQQHPDERAQLLAVAEAIEQAAALPEAPPPSNLVNLTSAAATKFGGPYGAIAGIALQGGFALYQQFYSANASSALDKQPALKAVLLSLSSGIRAAAQGGTVPAAPASPATLSAEDLVLRPAR